MTRFAHFHHLVLLCLVPFAFSMACVPVLSSLAAHFEAWVERTDWRRADRSLTGTTTFVLFSAATALSLALLAAVFTGAFSRMVR